MFGSKMARKARDKRLGTFNDMPWMAAWLQCGSLHNSLYGLNALGRVKVGIHFWTTQNPLCF